ncbi:Protein shortage in CHIASMATA 1 [Heracleum sosnowskyi]|uniref:Protein shortage in CHIASMATA 1 n=1 Tax=Heracleum sosnowskyi TaxID=360622 RepID=A0AAD8N2P0_9APIA|nr:Protein shortage in CHIASMATA 1 [Heracleum sosnowskyi]
MRTRFLALDFLNTSAPIESLDDFLRFPIPQIQTPTQSISISGDKNLFDCIDTDDVSILSLSSQLQSVQIDTALSKFYDDVLPHHIQVDLCCFSQFSSDEKKTTVLPGDVDMEKQINFGTETLEEESGTTAHCKGDNIFEILMFEMPELDLSLGNVCTAQEKELKIFSEVSDVETSEDLLIPMLKVQDLCKIQESLFSVENISVEYPTDQSNFLLEDSSAFKVQNHPSYAEFPLFEVDVSSLGIFSSMSVDNEIKLLESIEPQIWWAEDDTLSDGKELLQFMELDILEYLSCNSLSNQRLETDNICSNFVKEIDLFSVIEHKVVLEKAEIYEGRPENTYVCLSTPILYEELQFFDLLSFQFSEFFSSIEALSEVETCQQMFCETSKVNNFNDLIVSHELTLLDESFKSLPVPILSYSRESSSVQEYLEDILAELKPQPSLTSDAIYLDWHIIEEGKCNSSRYSSCLKLLEELDDYAIDLSMKSFDAGVLVLDSVLSDDCQNVLNKKEDKEMLKMPSINTSVAHVCTEGTSSRALNDGCQKRVKGESPCNLESNSVSRLIKSMSECNNHEFFLNPTKSTVTKNPGTNKAVGTNATVPGGSASDFIEATEQWNIELHQIRLSDNILILLDDLSKTYQGVLDSDVELGKRKYSCLAADDFTLLAISNKKLMDWMTEIGTGPSLANNNDNMVPLITLYAIKQMAWYLCYYGIHATYLYINNLHQKLQCSKCRLSFLWGLVLDAHEKVKKEIIRCHPSLSVIHGILKLKFRKNCKILIVAERVFWWPLEMLLNSMEISSFNAQSFQTHTNELGTCYDIPSVDSIMEAVVHSDSCLISLEHISTSFPFGKFDIIMEYGGSYGSSKLSTISPEVSGFPILHFLKMDLENSSAARALCENVDTPSCRKIRDGDPQSGLIIGENQKLEELLNFVPTNEYNAGSSRAANCFKPMSIPQSLPCPQLDMKTTQAFPGMSSFPDAIIVVNTQSVDNEMIISRRSTYQKILAMEKEGTQVVERDLHHPVDVIVNASVCLVCYDCKNIRKKATASNEASSSLPSCIENIAANGLTALSFTFSGCILIFEGQSSFLGGVMESSDELYAAAASLGMDLQLFFSYSSEMTDEIILSCIKHKSNFTKGLYPTMPESETLAESFLTTFPSLNPLSAHAILSSVGVLIEFLESSHTDRVRAVQKYQISDESIALLNACFRYGEREDCKSGTTDCSSSVSSAPDSDSCPIKSASEMRKRKYIQSTLNVDLPMNELFHLDTSKLYAEGGETPKRMSKPNDTWLSEEDPDVFNEVGKSSLSFENELFPQKSRSNINSKVTPSRMSKPSGSYISKSRIMSEERVNNVLPADDALFCQNQGPESRTGNKFDMWSSINSENFIQNFIGEVINIDDELPGAEDSLAENFSGLSYLKSNMERDSPLVFSKTARKLSFDNNTLPTFPRAAEINYDTDGFISTTSERKILAGQEHFKEQVFQNSDEEINIEEKMFSEHQKYLLKEDIQPKSVGSTCKYSLMENNMPHYRGTPLSNAIQFAQPHQGSPWTIEFLNRVREKSKLRQKFLPPDLSGPSFGNKANILKVTKRRSPSILEFFKYQKGSNPSKKMEQKRQKRTSQPSTSYDNEKTLPSFLPAMTPIDKRARQTLSFATPGSGGQSKLVWGDTGSHALKRQF